MHVRHFVGLGCAADADADADTDADAGVVNRFDMHTLVASAGTSRQTFLFPFAAFVAFAACGVHRANQIGFLWKNDIMARCQRLRHLRHLRRWLIWVLNLNLNLY
jgi:hypothetical protein